LFVSHALDHNSSLDKEEEEEEENIGNMNKEAKQLPFDENTTLKDIFAMLGRNDFSKERYPFLKHSVYHC